MTVTLEEAQATLPELVRGTPGEELHITDGGVVVATLVPAPPPPKANKPPRQLGTLRGTVLSMEHFDDPIEGLEEYM